MRVSCRWLPVINFSPFTRPVSSCSVGREAKKLSSKTYRSKVREMELPEPRQKYHMVLRQILLHSLVSELLYQLQRDMQKYPPLQHIRLPTQKRRNSSVGSRCQIRAQVVKTANWRSHDGIVLSPGTHYMRRCGLEHCLRQMIIPR